MPMVQVIKDLGHSTVSQSIYGDAKRTFPMQADADVAVIRIGAAFVDVGKDLSGRRQDPAPPE